jgi:guanine deaminase
LSDAVELFRATILHTPRNPFQHGNALEAYSDGALVVQNGRIIRCGDYESVSAAHPNAHVIDWRGGFILPGLIDTHIHFPQVRVLGALGHSLLDWLESVTFPEEARMRDELYARQISGEFLSALAAHGTTTALVFGAHFLSATAALMEMAADSGLRIVTGLVVSDRLVGEDLRQTPDAAYRDSKALIERFHGKGRLRYAVTPRFALSSSEAMLEVCGNLLKEYADLQFQTHLNENTREIAEVRRSFPWARDYLEVYERFGLSAPRSVFAHSVHTTDDELHRMSSAGAAVSHCPCSNAALGSGFFPLLRHLQAHVNFSLGTDVGGGTGFGVLKEALQAYLLQRLAPEPFSLNSSQMLYLATKAGAEALGLGQQIGDFEHGKDADFIHVLPQKGSALETITSTPEHPGRSLGAIFTLAGAESIQEVRVCGERVWPRTSDWDRAEKPGCHE